MKKIPEQIITTAKTPGTNLHRAIRGLVGCPVMGGPETQRALARIVDELPHNRSWSLVGLADALELRPHGDRWAWPASEVNPNEN